MVRRVPSFSVLFLTATAASLLSHSDSKASTETGAARASTALFLPKSGNTVAPSIAIGAEGRIHAAYATFGQAGPGVYPAYYATCASNCGAAANWSGTVAGDIGTFGGHVRLALDAAGHPRMLWRRQTDFDGDDSFLYAECNSGCSSSANWTRVEAATSDDIDLVEDTRYFDLDPQGRPRFLYTDHRTGHTGTFYAFCDSGCTVSSNWHEARISDDPDLYEFSLQFEAAGRPRAAFRRPSNDSGVLVYAGCDSNCGNGANWYYSEDLYQLGAGNALSLRLTSGGKPRLAFYQGFVSGSQTGNELLAYAWCNADCSSSQSWAGVYLGLPEYHGKDVDLVLDTQDRPVLAYYADASPYGLASARCSLECESLGSTWEIQWVENSDELNASNPVPPKPGCSLSVWYPGEQPSIVLGAAGSAFFAYEANHLQGGTCGAQTDIRLVRFASVGNTQPGATPTRTPTARPPILSSHGGSPGRSGGVLAIGLILAALISSRRFRRKHSGRRLS